MKKSFNFTLLKIFLIILIVFISQIFIVKGALSDGLVNYYDFTKTDNNITDVVSGRNGTVVGTGLLNVNGVLGNAKNLSDGSSYITLPTQDINTISISFWVKSKIIDSNGMLLGTQKTDDTNIFKVYQYDTSGSTTRISFMFANNHATNYWGYYGNISISINSWYHIVVIRKNGVGEIWVNGVNNSLTSFYSSGTVSNGSIVTAQPLCVACLYKGSASQIYKGGLDEIGIWNRVLSSSEISSLYNNGNGLSPLIPPNPIVINSLNITTHKGIYFNSTTFTQLNNAFYVVSNVSVNDGYDNLNNALNCNIKINNVSYENFNNYSSVNITLTNTNQFSFISNNSVSNILSERITYHLCRTQINFDNIGFYYNGVEVKTLNTEIPRCSVGYHEDVYIPSANYTQITNITIKCKDCNPSETYILSVFGDDYNTPITNIDYDRTYFNLTLPLTYNSTSKLLQYNTKLLGFDIQGVQSVNLNCNDTNQSFSFNVGSFPPTTKIIQIGNITPINNLTFPYYSFEDSDLFISVENIGGIILNSNITVFNSTGGYYFITGESGTVPYTFFNKNSNYTIVARSNNNNGSSSDSIIITVVDTSSPVISWIFPNNLNTSYTLLDQSARIQAIFSDLNLWGYNISCVSTGMGGAVVLSSFRTGLTSPTVFLDNLTLPISVIGSKSLVCQAEICDSHTLSDWNFTSVNLDRDKRNVFLDDRSVFRDSSTFQVKSVDFTQLRDRLSYCFDYIYLADYFKSNVPLSYTVNKSDGWELVGKDAFANWKTKQWLDYKSNNFVIDSVTESSYDFIIRGNVPNPKEKVCFSSIGGLNCKNEIVYADVLISAPVSPGGNVTGLSVETIGSGTAFYFGFLAFFWIILVIASVFKRSVLLGLMGVMFGFWFSISIFSFSSMIGVGSLFLSAFIFISLAFNSKL